MREIKFRAWDKKCIEVYGTGMSYGEHEYFDDMLAFRFNHFESDNPSEIIYEQFTGLCDKNGREVYEGDICNVLSPDGLNTHSVVVFVDGCFELHFISPVVIRGAYNDRDYLKCHTVNHAVEVIGNIHENSEPLK